MRVAAAARAGRGAEEGERLDREPHAPLRAKVNEEIGVRPQHRDLPCGIGGPSAAQRPAARERGSARSAETCRAGEGVRPQRRDLLDRERDGERSTDTEREMERESLRQRARDSARACARFASHHRAVPHAAEQRGGVLRADAPAAGPTAAYALELVGEAEEGGGVVGDVAAGDAGGVGGVGGGGGGGGEDVKR